jgi:hypothetical protein
MIEVGPVWRGAIKVDDKTFLKRIERTKTYADCGIPSELMLDENKSSSHKRR